MCKKCGTPKCGCPSQTVKVINKYSPKGIQGKPGRSGKNAASTLITVKDGVVNTVSGVNEIRFTDANALVTNPAPGVAEVKFIPPASVWYDVLNLDWYVGAGVDSFKPQYTIEGNRITFRGLLYIPLEYDTIARTVTAGNSYLTWPSAVLHEGSVSVISNANTNNGTPQGRAMTTNVTTKKNVAALHIPQGRDIQFNNVPCYRRYSDGTRVTLYRSYVMMRIGSTATPYLVGGVSPTGCIMVFSPWNEEYDGAGTPPLGNDPLALGITRVGNDTTAADYIANLDQHPWSIVSSGANNSFACNAHHIQSLGGFIINLEGLSGYIN